MCKQIINNATSNPGVQILLTCLFYVGYLVWGIYGYYHSIDNMHELKKCFIGITIFIVNLLGASTSLFVLLHILYIAVTKRFASSNLIFDFGNLFIFLAGLCCILFKSTSCVNIEISNDVMRILQVSTWCSFAFVILRIIAIIRKMFYIRLSSPLLDISDSDVNAEL